MSERPLSIGIVCYPTFGGSGVVASEVALGMAGRGHAVHVFAYDRPARLTAIDPGGAPTPVGAGVLTFHKVQVIDYPVFHHPPYAIALASRIVDVALHHDLDIIHVHYAVPHATSAMLARQVLETEARRPVRIATTLHGTDITLVGSDPTYRPITRASILSSDVVTTPSRSLADDTRRLFAIDRDIEVIPNFIDPQRFAPATRRAGPPRIVHVSNFRAVKRITDLVAIFEGVARRSDAHLVLVGDGPELGPAERRLRELGLRERVSFYGHLHNLPEVLADADLFLLPSGQESFGVAALEAMACGIPAVVSDVGGLPEVVTQGETGYLCPVGDIPAFVERVLSLVAAPSLAQAMGARAREDAVSRFSMDLALDRYDAMYRRLTA